MIGRGLAEEVIGDELQGAINRSRDADNGRRQLAIAYYNGEAPESDSDDPDNLERTAVSLDVGDMVEAVYAQMAPSFADVGALEFEATDEQDEAQARQESEIVRTMLIEGNGCDGGFIALTEAIKNALLMRTGVLSLWVDTTHTRSPETWSNVSAVGLGEIQAPETPRQTIENVKIDDDRDNDGAYTVSLTRVDTQKRLAMAAVAPENFVTSGLEERDPNATRFSADRMLISRTRLVEMGFDAAEVGMLTRAEPDSYENYVDRGIPRDSDRAAQSATELIEVWRCYAMLADSEGASTAQRYRLYYSNKDRRMIGKPVKVGRVCYAVGNVILYPHRLDGVSMFDRIGEVQQIKSRVLRDWIENQRKVNRPRLGVDETLANLADAKDATADIIRTKGPNALTPVPTADGGPSSMMFLQYMDQTRSERGGASLEMQSASLQLAANQTAQGIERQYSTKEQLAATMARTFAETALRQAYQIAHYLLRTQWGGPLSAKLGGKWVTVEPSKWKPRNGVKVTVGQSVSQRARHQGNLSQVMQWQAGAMGSGKAGILTDDVKTYNAAFDWIVASQLGAPDRYLIDPASEGAQKAAQAQQQAQQAAQQQQAAVQRAVLMAEKYKVDVNALGDLIGEIVRASIEEAKLTLNPAPVQDAKAIAGGAAAGAAESVAVTDDAAEKGMQ